MTKEELDQLIAKMTPAEKSEFFALMQAEKKEPVFRALEHSWQTKFLDDPARMKILLCTRRAGKSYAAGLMLLEAAYKNPGVSCLYVALTRASAKRIMWKDVLKTIDREQGMQCRFNETELSVTLPNGSIIYLLGMDADEQEKEKALGQKFKAVAVDEAASYNVDLHEIVYGILKPATADYRGTIALIGTPGNIKRGVFFNLTAGQDPSVPGQWEKDGWSCYRWTAFENPKVAEQWKAEIEDLKLANPAIEQTPLFQQHYLGKWVVDNANLVYRFDATKNTFEQLPTMTKGGRWHYVLGIDLGFNDPTAWVVCAYHDFDRTLYVLGAHKKEKCDITEVADQTRKLMQRFEFDRIVIDNANKQAVEEMRRRHDLPLTPAEKTGKADFIELMNGDLVSGYIKFHKKAALPLIEEYGSLIWDPRSPRREEHPASPKHCCFVDGTLVTTMRGDVPIESITTDDLVLTRDGWKPVEYCVLSGVKPVLEVRFSDGRTTIGTPEHPIWTENRGWIELKDLTMTDVFVTSVAPCENSTREARQKWWSGTERFGDVGLSQRAEATVFTSNANYSGFIGRFGSTITGLFQKAFTFITKTATRSTTTLATWSAWPLLSTTGTTMPPPVMTLRPSGVQGLREPVRPRPNGTPRPRAASGIGSTLLRLRQAVRTWWCNARSVVLSSTPSVQRAEFAVERVTPAGTARVWALKVSGKPEYFANGVLVHNCDAMLYAWRHCYQWLSEMRKPDGLRHGQDEANWMLILEEQEMERLLEDKRAQAEEAEQWGHPLLPH